MPDPGPLRLPAFRPDQRLSDWPGCTLEVACPCSPALTILPVQMLLDQRGDLAFGAVLAALRCRACGGKPAPVWLVAGVHRRACGGAGADWALEVVPERRG